jgi:hypothetical protein
MTTTTTTKITRSTMLSKFIKDGRYAAAFAAMLKSDLTPPPDVWADVQQSHTPSEAKGTMFGAKVHQTAWESVDLIITSGWWTPNGSYKIGEGQKFTVRGKEYIHVFLIPEVTEDFCATVDKLQKAQRKRRRALDSSIFTHGSDCLTVALVGRYTGKALSWQQCASAISPSGADRVLRMSEVHERKGKLDTAWQSIFPCPLPATATATGSPHAA